MSPSSQLTCTQLIATQCLKLMPVDDCWLIMLVRYDLLEWKDCKYLQVARPRKKLYKLCTSACTVHLLILLILYRRGNYAGGHCQLYVSLLRCLTASICFQRRLTFFIFSSEETYHNLEMWQGDASPAPILMHTNGKACLFSHFFCLSPSLSGDTLSELAAAITCVLSILPTNLASVRIGCQALDYLLAPIMVRTGESLRSPGRTVEHECPKAPPMEIEPSTFKMWGLTLPTRL